MFLYIIPLTHKFYHSRELFPMLWEVALSSSILERRFPQVVQIIGLGGVGPYGNAKTLHHSRDAIECTKLVSYI
jgi:hypothetical protein